MQEPNMDDINNCLRVIQRALMLTTQVMSDIRDQSKIAFYEEFLGKAKELLFDMTRRHERYGPSITYSIMRNSLNNIKEGELKLAEIFPRRTQHTPIYPPHILPSQRSPLGERQPGVSMNSERIVPVSMQPRLRQTNLINPVNYSPDSNRRNMIPMGVNTITNFRNIPAAPPYSVSSTYTRGQSEDEQYSQHSLARHGTVEANYSEQRKVGTERIENRATYEHSFPKQSNEFIQSPKTNNEGRIEEISPNPSLARDPFALFREGPTELQAAKRGNPSSPQHLKCDRCPKYVPRLNSFPTCMHRFCDICYQQFNHECIFCKESH